MGYDKDYCNRQYNARAMVPDHADFIRRWADDSRAARQALPCFLDIPWGEGPGQRLDMFPARRREAAGAPLLVFLHGGYWRSLDKSDFSYLAPAFTRAGAALAVVNYRLVPGVSLEDLVLDVVAATAWCHRNAQRYGADPRRIHVAGHSAGGHLAAMMLACEWPRWQPGLPRDLVKGALAISGLYDLEPIMHAEFLNTDLGLDLARVSRLSPAWMQPATDAALMTSVGGAESDEFARQNRLIAKQWPAAFRRDVPMPGHHHFSICSALADRTSPLHRAALELLGL